MATQSSPQNLVALHEHHNCLVLTNFLFQSMAKPKPDLDSRDQTKTTDWVQDPKNNTKSFTA